MNKKIMSAVGFLLFVLAMHWSSDGCAQAGGLGNMDFLHLPQSSKVSGLGGINVSSYGNDANMFISNPALLTDSTNGSFGLNYFNYYAGITNSNLAFTNSFGKAGNFGIGLQYLDYGTFDKNDNTEASLGEFRANDFALTIGKSHALGNIVMGGNLKFARSTIDVYSASALLLDMGGAFIHPKLDLIVGLTVKNIGFAFNTYSENSRYTSPLDVQLGSSFHPKGMPFRFTLTMHKLHRFLNTSYYDPQSKLNPDAQKPSFFNKLSHHMIIGGELLLGKALSAQIGYNFQRRRDLKLRDVGGLTGFSFGVQLKLKKFTIGYSNSTYHISGSTHQLSLAVHTRMFSSKKSLTVDDE